MFQEGTPYIYEPKCDICGYIIKTRQPISYLANGGVAHAHCAIDHPTPPHEPDPPPSEEKPQSPLPIPFRPRKSPKPKPEEEKSL